MKCRWKHCSACIHVCQLTSLLDLSIPWCESDSAEGLSSFLQLHIKNGNNSKKREQRWGRRREEPWFKSQVGLAISGSHGTIGFAVSNFRSHMSGVSALRREKGWWFYMAQVALHVPDSSSVLWDSFKKHSLDFCCIYKPSQITCLLKLVLWSG